MALSLIALTLAAAPVGVALGAGGTPALPGDRFIGSPFASPLGEPSSLRSSLGDTRQTRHAPGPTGSVRQAPGSAGVSPAPRGTANGCHAAEPALAGDPAASSLSGVMLDSGAKPALPGDELTLDEAVRQAVARSPQVAATRAKLVQAKARTSEVWAAVFPQISMSGSLMRLDMLGGTSAGLSGLGGLGGGGLGSAGLGSAAGGAGLGGTDPNPLAGAGAGGLGGVGGLGGLGGAGAFSNAGYHQIQGSISVNQVVFDGMRTQSGLHLSDLQERLSLNDLEAAARRAAIDAATAYFQTLRAEALAEVAGRATMQARQQLERAQIRMRSGTGMKLDVLQAQAALAGFRVQQSAADNSARRARVGLSALLGQEITGPLGGAMLPKADVDLARDLPAASSHRPEVMQVDVKIAMDREQIVVQERSAWPTAGVFGTLSWQGGGGSRYDALGVQANWALLDAGKIRARVEQANAELAADRAIRQGLERNIEAEIRRSLLDRHDAQERVVMASEGLEAAREALRLAEIRHQTGGGTIYDVSDAHQTVVRAESDVINARFEIELAEVRLAAALGVPLSNLGLEVDHPDVSAPNRKM